MSPLRPARLAALDALRGVAALIVLVHHVSMTNPEISAAYESSRGVAAFSVGWWTTLTPLKILFSGPEFVLVFFVLSGFVLVLSPLAARERLPGTQPYDWVAYYPRRVIRLALPVLASVGLAIVWIVLVPRTGGDAGGAWLARQNSPDLSLGNVLREASIIGQAGRPDVNPPLWSLAWEMWFSLLLPVGVLLAAVSRGRRRGTRPGARRTGPAQSGTPGDTLGTPGSTGTPGFPGFPGSPTAPDTPDTAGHPSSPDTLDTVGHPSSPTAPGSPNTPGSTVDTRDSSGSRDTRGPVPAAGARAGRPRRRLGTVPRVTLWAALFCALGSLGYLVNVEPIMYLPAFALGALLAANLEALRACSAALTRRRGGTLAWVGVAALGPFLLVAHWMLRPVVSGPWSDVTLSLRIPGAFLVVAAVALWVPLQRPLGNKVLVWLGSVSFSLYLVHFPIVVAFAELAGPDRWWLGALVSVPLSLFLAQLMTRWVENPSQRLAARAGTATVRIRRRFRRNRVTPADSRPSGRKSPSNS